MGNLTGSMLLNEILRSTDFIVIMVGFVVAAIIIEIITREYKISRTNRKLLLFYFGFIIFIGILIYTGITPPPIELIFNTNLETARLLFLTFSVVFGCLIFKIQIILGKTYADIW